MVGNTLVIHSVCRWNGQCVGLGTERPGSWACRSPSYHGARAAFGVPISSSKALTHSFLDERLIFSGVKEAMSMIGVDLFFPPMRALKLDEEN